MSIAERQAAKARAINLDDDTETPSPAPTRTGPRTAPGQLMDLQGRYADAKDRIKELEAQLASGQALEIPLDQLHEVPGRRRRLTDEQFSELVENLRNNPLVQAITVRPRAEGGFEIISGNNRTAAYRKLGREKIMAVGLQANDEQVDLSAFYANLLQPSLPDYEKYQGFKRRQEKTGKTQRELAEEAGIPETTVSSLFSFERLPDEAKAHLDAKPQILGYHAAIKLVQACTSGNADLVIEAVQMLATNSRFTQAQAIAYATKKREPVAARSAPLVIKDGKTVVCKIEARGSRLLVDFGSAEATADWARRFADYVKQETTKNR
jgi:ParB family transcriptional regulator, chromosome partitioning protein